jgi:hypothetical protein
MRCSVFSSQLTTLWCLSTNWLAGLYGNFAANTREYFRLTDFWATLYSRNYSGRNMADNVKTPTHFFTLLRKIRKTCLNSRLSEDFPTCCLPNSNQSRDLSVNSLGYSLTCVTDTQITFCVRIWRGFTLLSWIDWYFFFLPIISSPSFLTMNAN